MQKYFCLIIIGVALVACSSGPKEILPLPKVEPIYQPAFQPETESREEYLRRMAIERYRLLRLEALSNPEKKTPIKEESNRQKSEVIIKQYKPKEAVPAYSEAPEVLLKRKEDREAEIMQNFDMFCIKNQDEQDFETEAECRDFCSKVLLECESEVENGLERKDRKMVLCVKNKLRR